MSSSAIDKMYEIYTFFENRYKIYFCSKIGSKFSNILSMVDELIIRHMPYFALTYIIKMSNNQQFRLSLILITITIFTYLCGVIVDFSTKED